MRKHSDIIHYNRIIKYIIVTKRDPILYEYYITMRYKYMRYKSVTRVNSIIMALRQQEEYREPIERGLEGKGHG